MHRQRIDTNAVVRLPARHGGSAPLLLAVAVCASACLPACAPATPTTLPTAALAVPTDAPSPPAVPTPDVTLFDYDQAAPLNVEETGAEQRDGATVRDITFAGPSDERVAAYLVLPAGEGPHPAILYVHWLGNVDSNRNQFLDEALLMASEGAASLLVDDIYSAPGARASWKSSSVADDRAEVVLQVVELRRALDVLLTEANVDPERVAVVGHDFGGMFGAVLAGVDPRVTALVVMAAAPDFSDWFLLDSTRLEDDLDSYLAGMAPLAPVRHVGLASAAILFQFARNDYYVSSTQANSLFEAAGDSGQVAWYDGGHEIHRNEQATQDRLEWLRTRLAVADGE